MAAVSKPTPGGGAPLGIDLESGVARIRIPRPAPAQQPEQEPQPVEDGQDRPTEAVDQPDPPATDR